MCGELTWASRVQVGALILNAWNQLPHWFLLWTPWCYSSSSSYSCDSYFCSILPPESPQHIDAFFLFAIFLLFHTHCLFRKCTREYDWKWPPGISVVSWWPHFWNSSQYLLISTSQDPLSLWHFGSYNCTASIPISNIQGYKTESLFFPLSLLSSVTKCS